MSRWTHITSCMSVDTCIENKKRIKKSIIDYINNAPKITGSESDAEVYVTLQRGYNISSWKQDKTAIFENGKIISYEEGSSNLKNGTETIKRYVRFNDKGEVYKVIFDYNQTTTAQKCFELKDKGWQNITNERVYLF